MQEDQGTLKQLGGLLPGLPDNPPHWLVLHSSCLQSFYTGSRCTSQQSFEAGKTSLACFGVLVRPYKAL
jgi:hypothetical protein